MTLVEALTDLQMLFRTIFTVLILMSFAGLACLAVPWLGQKIEAMRARQMECAREEFTVRFRMGEGAQQTEHAVQRELTPGGIGETGQVPLDGK